MGTSTKVITIKVDESTIVCPEMVEPVLDEIFDDEKDPEEQAQKKLARDYILQRLDSEKEGYAETTYGELPGRIFAFLDGYEAGVLAAQKDG